MPTGAPCSREASGRLVRKGVSSGLHILLTFHCSKSLAVSFLRSDCREPMKRAKIVVIEEEADIREVIEHNLTRVGYRFKYMENGV